MEEGLRTRQDAASPGPELLVLAAGIGPDDLESGPLRELLPEAHPVGLADACLDPVANLLAAFPAAELRRLGIGVDRLSLAMQPPWRSDEQAVEHIARRPFGPAQVTLLHLRSAMQVAASAGMGTAAWPAAKVRLAAAIARAVALIGRRGAPRVWLAGLGKPIAVAHTLDVGRLTRHLVGWPFARELTVTTTTAVARIEAPGRRALDLLRQRLSDSALAGATVHDEGHALVLLAPPCTAFGRRPVFARSAHREDRATMALLPHAPRTTASLDFAGLAARLCMAAAAGAVDRRRRRTQDPAVDTAAATAGEGLLPLAAPATEPATHLFSVEPLAEPSEFDDAPFLLSGGP